MKNSRQRDREGKSDAFTMTLIARSALKPRSDHVVASSLLGGFEQAANSVDKNLIKFKETKLLETFKQKRIPSHTNEVLNAMKSVQIIH